MSQRPQQRNFVGAQPMQQQQFAPPQRVLAPGRPPTRPPMPPSGDDDFMGPDGEDEGDANGHAAVQLRPSARAGFQPVELSQAEFIRAVEAAHVRCGSWFRLACELTTRTGVSCNERKLMRWVRGLGPPARTMLEFYPVLGHIGVD